MTLSAKESRRERLFEWNRENAKCGLFGTTPPDGAMPTCGVCVEAYEDQLAKAPSPWRTSTTRIVRVVNDGQLYEWWRP
jgi:hypothetical protein